MNIVLATSEAVPFAKTGGLADVCGALPLELHRQGHQVAVVMPAYRSVFKAGVAIEPTGIDLSIPIGRKMVTGRLLRGQFPGSDAPIYFVEQPEYFDRDDLYQVGGRDYPDNCERFVFFSRAVMEAVRQLDMDVDILHVNDWQTGLIPAYHKIEYKSVPKFERTASLMTVHNLSYQGMFWHWDMLLTGLDWKYFNWHQLEFYGQLNLLKTGLVFADAITTVSPRYAEEIQTGPLGCGLEGVLQQRKSALSGIINGVDYSQWNPETDAFLPTHYTLATVREGKAKCRAALQQEFNLPRDSTSNGGSAPVVAFVGRLAEQKGIDLLVPAIAEWVQSSGMQWVILGTGDPKYQEQLQTLAQRHPQKVAVKFEFSERLAHLIEAGADMLLMPSRFEPCGLSQLYSLKYGTVPIVRATGGLVDTVTNTTDESLAAGTATGFSFHDYSAFALSETLRRAVGLFAKPEVWSRIVNAGMNQDWSWGRSAREYVNLYQKTLGRVRSAQTALPTAIS
ncbi:MAG TPA: glycogen synthase GlgA [Pirellulales bacterium]|jgi:starch synthase